MVISIHALREEGDHGCAQEADPGKGISIHALREEGDGHAGLLFGGGGGFLSTPSARRATNTHKTNGGKQNISIHALREEGDFTVQGDEEGDEISIHALREEGDVSFDI